jgi:hypothetical protein
MPSLRRDVDTAGAIRARSTAVEPQTGQATAPSSRCVSNVSEFANQPSNSWRSSQRSA